MIREPPRSTRLAPLFPSTPLFRSRSVVDALRCPPVLTLKGLGALPAAHPLHLGMLGMHGSRAANMAVQESDLLVVVGARFDDRATGKLAEFAPLAEVIHLDLDAAEVGKLRHAHAGVVGDVAASLRALAGVIPDRKSTRLKSSH